MTQKEAMNLVYTELTYQVILVETYSDIKIFRQYEAERYMCCILDREPIEVSPIFTELSLAQAWNRE